MPASQSSVGRLRRDRPDPRFWSARPVGRRVFRDCAAPGCLDQRGQLGRPAIPWPRLVGQGARFCLAHLGAGRPRRQPGADAEWRICRRDGDQPLAPESFVQVRVRAGTGRRTRYRAHPGQPRQRPGARGTGQPRQRPGARGAGRPAGRLACALRAARRQVTLTANEWAAACLSDPCSHACRQTPPAPAAPRVRQRSTTGTCARKARSARAGCCASTYRPPALS